MRNIVEIIDQVIALIPEDVEDREGLMSELADVQAAAPYAAPEIQYMMWQRLAVTLNIAFGFPPKEDWQWDIASLVTTLPVAELKAQVSG